MALTDKLAAIGDAIRAQTGKEEKLTLDQMPDEIAGISGGGGGGGASAPVLAPLTVTENGTYYPPYEAATVTWDEATEYDGVLSVDGIPLRYKKVANLTVPDDVSELENPEYCFAVTLPDGTVQSLPLSDLRLGSADGIYLANDISFAVVWVKDATYVNAGYGASLEDNTVYVTDYLWLAYGEDYAGESLSLTAPGQKIDGFSSVTVDVESSPPVMQTKEITVTENGTIEITPDSGYDGFTKIVLAVNVVGGGGASGVFDGEIVSWADGTDEQIAAMVAALDDGTLTIEETGWKIGDERKVTLSAMDAIGVTESHVTQDVTLVLMDSQHYNLTEATPGGDTKDHFVVGLKNVLANGTQWEQGGMYKTATENASWGECDRRVWCNNVFRMAIPNALRGCFKQFKVPSATTYDGSSVTETDDYFAMFAEMEVQGVRTYSNTYESAALSQIEWYKTDTNRIKRAGDSGDAVRWITRSLRTKAGWFCSVKSDGTAEVQGTAAVLGLAPFGCI